MDEYQFVADEGYNLNLFKDLWIDYLNEHTDSDINLRVETFCKTYKDKVRSAVILTQFRYEKDDKKDPTLIEISVTSKRGVNGIKKDISRIAKKSRIENLVEVD